MYKVVKAFADLQDNKHMYAVGDTFPRGGVEVSKERVAELASTNNKCGTILIERVENGEIHAESEENKAVEQVIKNKPKQPKKRNKEK